MALLPIILEQLSALQGAGWPIVGVLAWLLHEKNRENDRLSLRILRMTMQQGDDR